MAAAAAGPPGSAPQAQRRVKAPPGGTAHARSRAPRRAGSSQADARAPAWARRAAPRAGAARIAGGASPRRTAQAAPCRPTHHTPAVRQPRTQRRWRRQRGAAGARIRTPRAGALWCVVFASGSMCSMHTDVVDSSSDTNNTQTYGDGWILGPVRETYSQRWSTVYTTDTRLVPGLPAASWALLLQPGVLHASRRLCVKSVRIGRLVVHVERRQAFFFRRTRVRCMGRCMYRRKP